MCLSSWGHGATEPRNRIPETVPVRWLFQITKYLYENPYNTTKDNKKRLLTFYILIMDEKVLVLCEKWLSKFSSNLYVLRHPESEKVVFTKVSVCLSVCL